MTAKEAVNKVLTRKWQTLDEIAKAAGAAGYTRQTAGLRNQLSGAVRAGIAESKRHDAASKKPMQRTLKVWRLKHQLETTSAAATAPLEPTDTGPPSAVAP